MDFLERLKDRVNLIPQLPIKCVLGYLRDGESFCVYPIAGSQVVTEYYDGAKDQALNFEFAMKSTDQQKIHATLWLVQNTLEELSTLNSVDGSFDFEGINITNKPFINQLSDTKEYIFLLDIQAKITTYVQEEK